MPSRFTRSCQLTKASWDVLRTDRELLLLPLLSVLAIVVGLFIWLTLMHAAGVNFPHTRHHHQDLLRVAQKDPVLFAWLFFAYLLFSFVASFFNAALVGAALDKLQGGNPTVGSAIALASQRAGAIFGYAFVSATLGVLMAMIVERVGGILGRLLGLGFDFAWTVASFLVVPILAAQGVGPITAIRESTTLLHNTWGENLIGNVGISLAMSAITTAIMILGFLGALGVSQLGHSELNAPIFVGAAFLFLVSMFLRGIYVAAVYYYAVAGEPSWGFAKDTLQGAFVTKGS